MSNIRSRYISSQTDTVVLDTLSLIPNSIQIALDSSFFSLNPWQATLIWKKKLPQDSIRITYRVLPYLITKRYFHKDIQRLNTNRAMPSYYYDAVEANTPFIDFGSIDYAGSFGRNLSFGNSQDVVLNSQFNLQLDGDLGDSIKLTGAITDNTVPFQPDGNTQQIQEFDRVFIQLSRKKSKLIVGDYDVKRPPGYFMNFYKRVQGGFVSKGFNSGKQGEHTLSFGASIAKGKFVRNTLTALEGNQGPYKLIGPNGEVFFIVLANTERVFIDGVLQNRGEDLDYIIDYNTAEITFMPRRLITKDLRIVVEFEFTDRNYLNSLFYVNDEWKVNNKCHVSFNMYSNQDARNQSIQQTLDSSQKFFLSQIGDSIQKAFYPSVQQIDTFSNSKILYKKLDTTVLGLTYLNVYVYSTNQDSAKYILSFNQVGQGRGNYKQAISLANGRVYQWVAPVNGLPQGDYEPIYILVTPKKQQLFTLGAQYHVDDKKTISWEGALSNSDPNLFSKIDNASHLGLASRIMYEEQRSISKSKEISLTSTAAYEFVDQQFRPLERFRQVEFARDWNVPVSTVFETEHLANFSSTLKKSNLGQLNYTFGSYFRGQSYSGYKHQASLSVAKHGQRLFLKGDMMSQQAQTFSSRFYRPIIEWEKEFKKLKSLTLGSKYLLEHNELKTSSRDSLLPQAFSFDIWSVYLRSAGQKQNNYQLEWIQRRDRAAKHNQFEQSTIGHTLSFSTAILSLKNQEIRLTSAYRRLQISDTSLTVLKPDETLLGRLDYTFNFLKGFCSGNLLYEFGSGQELKREFAYIEVPIGQGQYVWRDYNNDKQQQLNEFELAIFPDEKRFIKIFTPTNQYVKAKYSQYNQAMSLNPKALIPDAKNKGMYKALSIVYLQSAIQLSNRFMGSQGIEQYNPFINVANDSLLLQNNTSMVNSIFLNRMSNTWGLDYIRTNQGGRSLLNYGIDTRRSKENHLRGRYNLNQHFTMNTSLKKGVRTFTSPFLETRNYQIKVYSVEPGITWLLQHNKVRINASYKYDRRQNLEIYGNEKAVAHNMNLDAKYNIQSSGSFSARLTLANIAFNGLANSTIGYSMLDGLQMGKNWIWHANFDKRVSKNIEMSLEYDGRKSANNQVIHTGRASVRAVF